MINLSAIEISENIKSKKTSAQEVSQAFLQQIEAYNTKINAFITVNIAAMEKAEAVDKKIAQGEEVGLLAGVPVGIKDMLCTQGLTTTAGSKILQNFVPPYSATVVNKLEQAGAIIIGKCNQDEFAMGSSNELSIAGPCKNPWNEQYVPGGSSGGSAAAVASLMCASSIGTDTGGSIRQPASFCGVVGVKPTYGRVSRYGIIAFASSLDQAGPFARNVKDAALISQVICGKDVNDATSADCEVPHWSQQLSTDVKGLKIGMIKELFSDQMSEDTKAAMEKTIEHLKLQGAEVVEVTLPYLHHSVPIYYLVAVSEASSNLARYDGVRFGQRADFGKKPPQDLVDFYSRTRGEGFGDEVKRRIILGTYVLSSGYYDAYYRKACQVRRLLRDQVVSAFERCDVMISPVSNSPAFKIGERVNDSLKMYKNDSCTTVANLTGIPGMSVPVGYSQEGLPIGAQLLASHFMEQKMFNVAANIEQAYEAKVPNVIQ